MDDYSALAQRISVSVSGVTGALILSRDGLVLGAYPNEDESLAKAAWLRFTVLGEPEKSFVEFPDQVWAFVRRGPYGAFVLAEVGTRPGVLVDQMEQMLLVAEEGRSRRDTMRLPDAASAPSGKPRTSLHPSAAKPTPVEVGTRRAEPAEHVAAAGGAGAERQEAPLTVAEVPLTAAEVPASADETPRPAVGADDPAAEQDPRPNLAEEPRKLAGSGGGQGYDDDAEVDRVLLAKEFSGLLQVDSDRDEGSS
jgi:predicted regulator of Ras-like GTPase activity (Roadblock/LC7/MglB family)